MNDSEIIKALERWIKNFDGKATDYITLCSALDLINRQKAEIERLEETKNRLSYNLQSVLDERADHSEAVKEFAEGLKKKTYPFPCAVGVENAVTVRAINEYVEEYCG